MLQVIWLGWSIPMIGALALLLRPDRQPTHAPLPAAATPCSGRVTPSVAMADNAAVDLYWLPLGAGGHSVRFNGIVYETIAARLAHRAPLDIFHTALQIRLPTGQVAVEMTPVPNRRGWERGVVAEGPVGTKWAGQLRIFRYEVRRWLGGWIPDLSYATASPVRVTDDLATAARVFELLPSVPTPTWGRDELQAGEMWSCNSIISWALTQAGIDVDAIPLPARARAPGWDAGVTVARRAMVATRAETNSADGVATLRLTNGPTAPS